MGDLQRLAGVLLDHQDGDAHAVDLAHQGEDVPHHQGGEAERGLVHQQELRRRDERARDRNHLLLPAAERAGDLVVALAQSREAFEHLVDASLHEDLVSDGEAAEPQVVHDGERVPQLPALGHPGDAEHVNLVRLQAQEVDLAIEPHLAGARAQEAEQRLDNGGLARAIGAQDDAQLARHNLQRNAVDCRHCAVRYPQTLDLQERRHSSDPR